MGMFRESGARSRGAYPSLATSKDETDDQSGNTHDLGGKVLKEPEWVSLLLYGTEI